VVWFPWLRVYTLKSNILDMKLSVGCIHIFFERKNLFKEKAISPRKHPRTHKKQGPNTRIQSTLCSDHIVRKPDKICTHAWMCHRFRVWTPSRTEMQPKTYMTKRREHVHKALPHVPACTTNSMSRGRSLPSRCTPQPAWLLTFTRAPSNLLQPRHRWLTSENYTWNHMTLNRS